MKHLVYVVLMVIVIVAVDVLFFKGKPWARLAVNVGIVLLAAALYLWFVKRQ